MSAVEAVNQELIDDGMVDTDKIGPGNFYWSFPSKKDQEILRRRERVQSALDDAEASMEPLRKRRAAAAVGKEDTPERDEKVRRLNAMRNERQALEVEAETLKDRDPEEVARLEADIGTCKDAADRWTDNIYEIKSWLMKKRGVSSKEAKEMLKKMGLSNPDLEYVE